MKGVEWGVQKPLDFSFSTRFIPRKSGKPH